MTNPLSTSSYSKNADKMVLTRDDVDRLLQDDSSESRSNILEKVASHYNEKSLTEREQEIAEHIFRLLMRDMSLRVRKTLSERVKDNAEIPRDIVLHLAQDVESVAQPVLAVSKVLSDADLVSIVEATRDMGKLLAISQRESVSPRVSGALVETNYTPVVTSLLSNEGAEISEQSLSKIASDFAHEGDVMHALVQHPNLPITVVERLISKASDAVAAELKEKYNISADQVTEGANKVREEFMLRMLEGDLNPQEIQGLVARMHADETLTPSVLMTGLCRGQLLFFTVGLATIAGIPIDNAVQLIADRGEHGFNGIYRKSELPESMMDAVRLLLRAVQALEADPAPVGSRLYANRLVERVLADAGDQNIEYLPYFIALIRQQGVPRK